MGFFNFLKNQKEKYTDNLVRGTWREDLYEGLLPDELQFLMYDSVRLIKAACDRAAANPNRKTISKARDTITKVMKVAIRVQDLLSDNDIIDIKAEHLVTAFYLVNLSDISFRDIASFSDIEIKNSFATNLIGLGYDNVDPSEIPAISVVKTKETVQWLLSHPMD
ncbi:hypothetical protein Dacet_0691 [Denitrovibrio acetiphilus DSM 12809]|uniref:Uncharacterized protein n=1 Tax=Denitrovibrio acetiphilus (strain DSM 12809 / NBRC 114555 / N2460) TaxID=522772 RepID=D4H4T3_DENA2|nr:hypothetical protein [Denitrovibrio acetiphilus]ADD67477.1 hypothetical protein Dacet_0691 [Denitrovibrio acetiphilus DSM 12809]